MPDVQDRWISDPGEDGLRRALTQVAPELAGLPMRINPRPPHPNPMYWSASAWVGDGLVVKYAWSDIRAERMLREGVLLDRLGAHGLAVPEVVLVSDAPTLLVTRAVAGVPLDGDSATRLAAEVGPDLGRFLGRLHGMPADEILAGLLPITPTGQSDTARLRNDFLAIVDAQRARRVLEWCDWVDDVLTPDQEPVLVHGDLHGHNQLWDLSEPRPRLQAIVDLEESGLADPHFDFRYLPGNARTLDLVRAVVDAYQETTGRRLRAERIMAWHTLTHLGDALWRTEQGVGLPGGGTPATWVDDLAHRLRQTTPDPPG